MSLPKRILFWLLLILMVPTGFLLILEVGVRLFGDEPGATPGYVRTHPERRYELTPNFKGKTYDAPLRVNSYGLRDYERPISGGDDTYRICVIGDSITFGHGARLEDTFAKVLEDKLKESGKNVQVFNLGVPSYNTVSEMLYLKASYDTFRPHLVIVQYTATNDTASNDPPGSPKNINQIAVVRWLKDRFRRLYSYNFLAKKYYQLRYMLVFRRQAQDELQARLSHDELLYHDDYRGWTEVKQALRDIVQFCDSHNVTLVFAVQANNVALGETLATDSMLPIIDKVLRAMEAAGATHVVLLDEAFRGYAGREGELHVRPDDAHFSPLAHRLVANELLAYITTHGFLQ